MARKNYFSNISGTACALGLVLSTTYSNSTIPLNLVELPHKTLVENYNEINASEPYGKYGNHYILTDYSYRTLENEAEDWFGSMREATPEEQQSVKDYIESISVDTGVKFF